jgi:PAS domain S-box-containing protein
LIYYRDPLLDKICDRILGLAEPAFIKNSELVYVAVNDAYAHLFNTSATQLIGTGRGDHEEIEHLLHIEDKERSCLVFGDEQVSQFAHPFGKGRFSIELERFTLADGQSFLYGVFAPQAQVSADAVKAMQAISQQPAENLVEFQRHQGGDLTRQQFDQLTEELDVGLCIWDKDYKLTYFNDRLRSYYVGFMDNFHLGMDLRTGLEEGYDNLARVFPERFPATEEARRQAVDEKIASYAQERSSEYALLPNGRWLRVINRRQPDGSIFGLRLDVTDMKERELLLEQHIEHVSLYRELLNRLPVAAFVRGPDGKLAFLNQAYADFFGRSYEELIGTDVSDILTDDTGYAERADMANLRTLETGEEYAHEEDVPVTTGRVARSIVKIGRLITAKGTPFVVGTLVDISSIRQRELQLKEAIGQAEAVRQDIENIISSVDIGLIVLDKDLNVQLINEAYKQMMTDDVDAFPEMIGRHFSELLLENYARGRRPSKAKSFESYCHRRIADIRRGRIEPSETLLQNGLSLLYSCIPLSEGRSLLCHVNLTELRKRDYEIAEAHQDAEKALQLVRTATDMMPEGLMVLEGDEIVFSNGGLAGLFNVPERLARPGASWEDLYRATAQQNPGASEEEIEESVDRFRQALMSGKDVSYDFPLDKDRWIHLEMRSGTDGQTVVICSDETMVVRREGELKHLVAKAEAADRAKSEFLANMSLEIRTPMNGILGMAELLSKSQLDTRQKAFTDIIVKSGKTLLTVINDILDISKLDAGNLELKYAPFDPAEAIEDVISLHAFKAAEKDIELIVRHSDAVPRQVMGDAVRFRQIIANLISNAVKFTERGHVTISSGVVSDGIGQAILGVSIEDTGVGIAPEMLGTIFEKFSQVETIGGRRHGTGLGLAIAQRLAHIQGGTISVHSIENMGSSFTFSLPVQVAEEQARPKPIPANVAGARVLIADDHDVARRHLLDQTAGWGFECAGAADGATTLSILEAAAENSVDVDVLLVDGQMPDMSGDELVRRIRANPQLARLAIVMMTSRDFGAGTDLMDDPHVQAQLMKPIRIPLLRDTLVEVIRTARSPRANRAPQTVLPIKPVPVDVASAGAAIKDTAGEPKVAAQPGAGLSPAGRSYILVAEDNEVNRIFFSQILESAGYDFTIVGNGEEAVEAWRHERPLMVLMDTSMPVLDGFEAAARIRTMEVGEGSGDRTPIIGVIAHMQESEQELCLSSGMDGHIVKPISPERLEEKIRQWIGDEIVSGGRNTL